MTGGSWIAAAIFTVSALGRSVRWWLACGCHSRCVQEMEAGNGEGEMNLKVGIIDVSEPSLACS